MFQYCSKTRSNNTVSATGLDSTMEVASHDSEPPQGSVEMKVREYLCAIMINDGTDRSFIVQCLARFVLTLAL